MKFEEQENGNLVYSNGNKVYTLVNMKDYVGSKSREWYETAPDCWRLMFYDEQKQDGLLHIEALVDSNGYYSRIMVVEGNIRRVLMLNGNYVEEDVIFETDSENDMYPKTRYVAYEDPFHEKRQPEFDKYLEKELPFRSEENKEYKGSVSSNDYLVSFINANIELSEEASRQSEEAIIK